MPHAWETVSESTKDSFPPRERSWARAALVWASPLFRVEDEGRAMTEMMRAWRTRGRS